MVQGWPSGVQVAISQMPALHCWEQHSAGVVQGWPSGVQVPAPQTPAVH